MTSQSYELVGRDQEVATITNAIQQLTSGHYIKECFFNLCGITGIGKTYLLNYMYAQHASSHTDSDIYTLFVDLSQFPTDKPLKDQQQYLVDMLRSAFVSDEPPEEHASATIGSSMAALIQRLSALQKPVLLLIDTVWGDISNLGDAFKAFVAWFEEQLLMPLMVQVRLVAVLSSRKPMFLHRFSVRRRKVELDLAPFSRNATAEQVRLEMGMPNAALEQRIFALTGGYPQATHALVAALHQVDEPPLEYLEQHEAILIEDIVMSLESRILQHLHMGEPFNRLFYIMTLFREFTTQTLRFLLDQFSDQLPTLNERGLYSLFSDLQRTDVISWSIDLNAYQIDRAIRHLFVRRISYLDPDLYRAVHQAATTYYQSLMDDLPTQRVTYLSEWLYHHLCLDNATDFAYSRVKQELQQLIHRYIVDNSTKVLSLPSRTEIVQELDSDAEILAHLTRLGVTTQDLVNFIIEEIANYDAATAKSMFHETSSVVP